MSACSDAQTMPLSNDFDMTTSLIARPRSAVLSTYAGTLPAPTPRAGLPAEYAARTMPLPPVARMSETPGWCMSVFVASIEGCSTHWMQSSGAPAATAASRTMRAASTEERCALGWNAKTTGLRVLSAMSDLKIVVDVGLVTGVTAHTTPTGSAISTTPVSSSRPMTPTVLRLAIELGTCSHAKMFFVALSSKTPRPVSATAICARWPCWCRPATDALRTIRSTSSCVRLMYWSRALRALSTRRSISSVVRAGASTVRASTAFVELFELMRPLRCPVGPGVGPRVLPRPDAPAPSAVSLLVKTFTRLDRGASLRGCRAEHRSLVPTPGPRRRVGSHDSRARDGRDHPSDHRHRPAPEARGGRGRR